MMRIRIWKVLPVLVLGIAMSEAGAAREQAMGVSATTPRPSAIAVTPAEASQHPNAVLVRRVAFQNGLTGASEVRAILPAAEIGPVPPVSVAKTSALVLSSFGMLSVIALLRLSRTL